MPEIKLCCICGKPIEDYGNNPDGAAWKKEDGSIEFGQFGPEDRCCNECDSRYVIPGRIYLYQKSREKHEAN